jgi:hypothetical protein
MGNDCMKMKKTIFAFFVCLIVIQQSKAGGIAFVGGIALIAGGFKCMKTSYEEYEKATHPNLKEHITEHFTQPSIQNVYVKYKNQEKIDDGETAKAIIDVVYGPGHLSAFNAVKNALWHGKEVENELVEMAAQEVKDECIRLKNKYGTVVIYGAIGIILVGKGIDLVFG